MAKTTITFSAESTLLLEAFRLLESSREKYYDWLCHVFGCSEEADIIASQKTDAYYNTLRDELKKDIDALIYDWVASMPEKNEI